MKKVVRDLLGKLKSELLVLDWKKRQQTRAAVETTIRQVFDKGLAEGGGGLPTKYGRRIFADKVAAVFQHIFECYHGAGQSVYEAAA